MRRDPGFTLIEMLAVILLTSVVMAAWSEDESRGTKAGTHGWWSWRGGLCSELVLRSLAGAEYSATSLFNRLPKTSNCRWEIDVPIIEALPNPASAAVPPCPMVSHRNRFAGRTLPQSI